MSHTSQSKEKHMASSGEHDPGHPGSPLPLRNARSHEDVPTITQLARTLLAGRWTLLATIAVAAVAAAGYLLLARPTYQSDVLVQVDPDREKLGGVNEMSALFGDGRLAGAREATSAAEIEVIRSRQVLGHVVTELGLDVEARPRTLPALGDAMVRRHHGSGIAPAPLGLARFAWGGEKVEVSRLEVPAALLGKKLVATALGDGRFRIEGPDGAFRVEGKVGALATADTSDGPVEVLLSTLEARPRTQFVLVRRSWAEAVADLTKNLEVTERAKDSGALALTLEGPDPARLAAILDAIATRYLRFHAERATHASAQTLTLVEAQLPKMKSNVEKAEAALQAFRQRYETVDLPRETETAIARTAEVEKQIADLEVERADLRNRYSDRYPGMAALDERIGALRARRAAMDVRLKTLPEKELQSARLTRDVSVASELYVLLLNRTQELRVVSARSPQDVQLVDRALVPAKPVEPRPRPVLVLALLAGLGAGVALVLTRASFADRAEDPADVEAVTGLSVLATVPHSAAQNKAERGRQRGHGAALSALEPADVAVENLRSLRTSLDSALATAPNNVVSIDGPTPGVGKSFVCVNLGHLLASAGRRVLVIDADMRRGHLSRQFGVERNPGLSEILSGDVDVDAAIRHTVPGLDVITSGRRPANPAELLASDAFKRLLEGIRGRYDVVLVDTPSILAVTDCAIVARHAGLNLLVLRAGEHPAAEITLAMERLSQNGIKIHGAILNDVRAANGRYGRNGRYRGYYEDRRTAEE